MNIYLYRPKDFLAYKKGNKYEVVLILQGQVLSLNILNCYLNSFHKIWILLYQWIHKWINFYINSLRILKSISTLFHISFQESNQLHSFLYICPYANIGHENICLYLQIGFQWIISCKLALLNFGLDAAGSYNGHLGLCDILQIIVIGVRDLLSCEISKKVFALVFIDL